VISARSDEPTTAEKLRGLPWSVAMGGANSVFAQLTLLGWVFVLFLSELGLSKTEIGLLLSMFPLSGVLAPLIGPWAARFGYKRTYLVFFGLRKVVAGLLVLTPVVIARFDSRITLIFVLGVVTTFAVCRAIGETALYPWIQEYVPNSVRGKYSAADNIFATLGAFLAVTTAGYVVGRSADLSRFTVLFAAGVVAGLISVWAGSHIPGGAPGRTSHRTGLWENLAIVGRDADFRRYLVGVGLMTLTSVPLVSFLPLFVKERLGLSPGRVILVQAGILLGTLVSSFVWGWAADRYGSKPVMLAGVSLAVIMPACWVLTPQRTVLTLPAALAVAFLQGVANIGWLIGSTRMLFVNVVPRQHSSRYMAVYYAWIGITGAVSQMVAGRVLDGQVLGAFQFLKVDPYTLLFGAGILLPAASFLVLRRVREEEGGLSVLQFAGLFVRGNPFLALESSVRFYRATDERTTVSVTERLAQAKSPLNVDELLEALDDPRFNVRFEAILSIARSHPEQRLTRRLSRVLDGDEPALGVVAAWALGRIGDPGGIEPLRKGMSSHYRSIQAHCARALGSLGDAESAPMLLERLKTETDRGLRMAYASALGKLHIVEAVEPLMEFLQGSEDRSTRLELALALARIVGDESSFIRLSRQFPTSFGTAAAQALESLGKRLERYGSESALGSERIQAAVDAFARDDLELGVSLLQEIIELAPRRSMSPSAPYILAGCARGLSGCGLARPEYVLLALHALNADRRSKDRRKEL
jgi:MFS family permease